MDALEKVRIADPNRSWKSMERRSFKLVEEFGELAEAYLNVTSKKNPKKKTWLDVREEQVDLFIMACDVLFLKLPIDKGKTKEQIRQEIESMLDKKLAKWAKQRKKKIDVRKNK